MSVIRRGNGEASRIPGAVHQREKRSPIGRKREVCDVAARIHGQRIKEAVEHCHRLPRRPPAREIEPPGDDLAARARDEKSGRYVGPGGVSRNGAPPLLARLHDQEFPSGEEPLNRIVARREESAVPERLRNVESNCAGDRVGLGERSECPSVVGYGVEPARVARDDNGAVTAPRRGRAPKGISASVVGCPPVSAIFLSCRERVK